MKAELISIGDEILIGQIVNTNSVFLAKQFNRIGVEIAQITAISDQKNVNEEIVFKNEIGRIRDIQIHPLNGKLFFLSQNALWLMEKN